MFSKFLFVLFITITTLQFSHASEDTIYGGRIGLKNGNTGDIQLRLHGDGTYQVFIRELNKDITLCESYKNSYWMLNYRSLVLEGFGLAQAVSCSEKGVCFSTEISKFVPLVGGNNMVLAPIENGDFEASPTLPKCK